MQSNTANDVLDRLLEPVVSCLNTEAARKIVDLRADSVVQARVDELAEKCNEGQLSPAEFSEYQRYVAAGSLIAILKAQARMIIADSQNS